MTTESDVYFSNMYCYGNSFSMVGITGIVNCTGYVYIGPGWMYAIHIPFDKNQVEEHACTTFINCINNNGAAVGPNGHLFAFVNGTNRAVSDSAQYSADDLALRLKTGLGDPRTKVIRIMRGLGTKSGTTLADSVAIMVKRVHAGSNDPSGCSMHYKRNNDIIWQQGGEPMIGQYKPMANPEFLKIQKPDNLVAGWVAVNKKNCTIKSV